MYVRSIFVSQCEHERQTKEIWRLVRLQSRVKVEQFDFERGSKFEQRKRRRRKDRPIVHNELDFNFQNA